MIMIWSSCQANCQTHATEMDVMGISSSELQTCRDFTILCFAPQTLLFSQNVSLAMMTPKGRTCILDWN